MSANDGLDGGGVRGLSSLLILQRLLHSLSEEDSDTVKACDYFDLIVGTSTGGLIAVMLGRLQMDIDRCITEYLSLAPIVFPEKNFVAKSKLAKVLKLVRGNAFFDPKPMERQIKALVEKQMGARATDGADTLLCGNGTSECKVSALSKYFPPRHLIDKVRVLCCTAVEPRTSIRLRTYMAPNHSRTIRPTIWQACLATSAAPTLFPPISFGSPRREFVDGGLGLTILSECSSMKSVSYGPGEL
jgi:patatin-like phospholipase/acyl hydrolase